MWIELKTAPNRNGNCRRLWIRFDVRGFVCQTRDTIPPAGSARVGASFQVTPAGFREYEALHKAREESGKNAESSATSTL